MALTLARSVSPRWMLVKPRLTMRFPSRPQALTMVRSQIERFRIHDQRHTFGSRPVSEGVSLSQVGPLLGHTQPNTTARYAHLSKDSLRAALALLASPSKPVALLESDDADAAGLIAPDRELCWLSRLAAAMGTTAPLGEAGAGVQRGRIERFGLSLSSDRVR